MPAREDRTLPAARPLADAATNALLVGRGLCQTAAQQTPASRRAGPESMAVSKTLKNLLALALGLLVALGVGELALRLAGFESPRFFVPDPGNRRC